MNGYDSVFANAKDEELEFEVMFDQEDALIDTIVGCNESGDPLTGAEPCPAATAEERSDDESNPDYEKDIDAADSKDAPKDAEGTVGYDFEDKPEIKGEVDDQTKPEAEPVEGEDEYQEKEDSDKGVEDTVTGTIENDKDVLEAYFAEAEDDELGYVEKDTEEERLTDAPEVTPDDIEATAKEVAKESDATDAEEVVDNSDKGVEDTVTGTIENDKDVLEAYFAEAEDELSGSDTDSSKNADERSCDDCNPDYEKDVDAKDSKDAPKDAEGTVGYDLEVKPEIDSKVDEQTTVDAKDVKVEEEAELDYEGMAPEGTEKTSPAGPTDIETDCGDVAGATNAVVGYDFENEAAEAEEPEIDKIDKDVEEIENPEGYIDDDAIDDVESKDPKTNLDYDMSDEDIIDYAINNK